MSTTTPTITFIEARNESGCIVYCFKRGEVDYEVQAPWMRSMGGAFVMGDGATSYDVCRYSRTRHGRSQTSLKAGDAVGQELALMVFDMHSIHSQVTRDVKDWDLYKNFNKTPFLTVKAATAREAFAQGAKATGEKWHRRNGLTTRVAEVQGAMINTPLSQGEKSAETPVKEATTPTTEITIKLTVSDGFLQDVFCTAMEGGSNYWATPSKIKTVPGEYGDEWNAATISPNSECRGDFEPKHIGLPELREGVRVMLERGKCASQHKESLLRAVIEDDAGNVDAEIADLIMQSAVFDGDVIYG